MANTNQSVFDAFNENMDLVAETLVNMTAVGNVSIDTFQRAASAMDFLNKQQEQRWKLEDRLLKQGKDAEKQRDKQLQQLKQLGSTATVAFAALSAGVLKMTQAASPAVFHYLGDALNLLAAEVGTALIPGILSFTDTILDLVDWWNTLSDSTKALIGNTTLLVAAGLGVATVLGRVVSLLVSFTSGIRALAVAAYNHPIIALVGILGAAAAAVGLFRSAVEDLREGLDRTKGHIDSLEKSLDKIAEGKPLTEKDLEPLAVEEREKLKNARTPIEKTQVLHEIRQRAILEVAGHPSDKKIGLQNEAIEKALRATQNEDADERFKMIWHQLQIHAGMSREDARGLARQVVQNAAGQGFFSSRGSQTDKQLEDTIKNVRDMLTLPKEKARAKERFAEEAMKVPDLKITTVKEERERKKIQRGLGYNKEMAPSFTSLDQARKNFQLAAFKSPLEQELLNVQRKQYQVAVQQLAEMRKKKDHPPLVR